MCPYAAAITFSLTLMFRNSRSVWNVRATPQLRDLVRRQPDDALAVEEDVAAVGRVDAGDEVEERRLARAVRADEAHDLAVADVEVQLVDARAARRRTSRRLELEERVARRSHDLHSRRPAQPLRPHDHEDDEERAEQDPARDRRLHDEAGLPDDGGEVRPTGWRTSRSDGRIWVSARTSTTSTT